MFAEELKTRGASYGFETYPGSHSCHLWRAHLPHFFFPASANTYRQEGNQGVVRVARVVRARRGTPTRVALLRGFLSIS